MALLLSSTCHIPLILNGNKVVGRIIGNIRNTYLFLNSPYVIAAIKRTKLVGCHVVDVKTKQVYIYPACQSCNAKFIGKENEHPFYARKDWLVPFRVEEATCENHSKSPEELLSDALAKISSHWDQVPEP